MMDIRCHNKLHGRLGDDRTIEVACNSRWCGKEPGNVVLHRFSLVTGELLETRLFKVPHKPTPLKEETKP